MNEFLKYEIINQISLNNKQKDQKMKLKSSKCQEINAEEELDKLFPPKSTTEEGEVKTIRASRKQANPFEISKLSDDLDEVITKLENEHTGFSKKLLDIFAQIFDELIRQEIIACSERGLLMVNVRNEVLETLKFMKKLNGSCFAYGITKDLMLQKEIIQKRKEIYELTEEVNRANETLQNFRYQREEQKRKEEEEDNFRRVEQTFKENQLIISNQQMVKQIEDVIDSEHKWLKALD